VPSAKSHASVTEPDDVENHEHCARPRTRYFESRSENRQKVGG